jgi:ribosomal protein S18 acetylase RimI-like enzyme
MRITLADRSHFQTVVSLVADCRDRLIAEGIHQWNEHYPNPDTVWQDLENGTLFLAQQGDQILGAVTLSQDQEPEYSGIPWRHPQPCLVIHRLCVSPGSQGSGIGSALMRFAEQRALDGRKGSIRLDVYSGNPRAVDIYRYLGYEIAGHIRFPSRGLPFHCMEKRIGLGSGKN